jgi:hypothetical protein
MPPEGSHVSFRRRTNRPVSCILPCANPHEEGPLAREVLDDVPVGRYSGALQLARSPIELEYHHMTRLFVRHNVADYRAWRKAYDDFDAERSKLGVTAHAVFQSIDDPNDLTVWHDFSTSQSAKSFASSARLKEVMGNAGVKGVPQIWFVSEAH